MKSTRHYGNTVKVWQRRWEKRKYKWKIKDRLEGKMVSIEGKGDS